MIKLWQYDHYMCCWSNNSTKFSKIHDSAL